LRLNQQHNWESET